MITMMNPKEEWLMKEKMNPKEEEDEEQLLKEEDRLSDLPDHIIQNILCFLPIRSAAQTIILSHRWKKVFFSIPHLDFISIAASKPPRSSPTIIYAPKEPPCDVRDINFLIKTLSLRDSNFPIKTLKLKSSQLSTQAFNFLINYPQIFDMQELHVKVKNQDYFNIPWSIINCGNLKVLRLNILFRNEDDDRIQSSLMKREFKFLHTMTLYKLSFILLFPDKHIFTDSSFPCLKNLTLRLCPLVKSLTLRCSELKDLVIYKCRDLSELDIYGLKLEKLKVEDCFDIYNNDDIKIKIIAPAMKVLKWLYIVSVHVPVFLEKLYLLEKVVIGLTQHDSHSKKFIIDQENIHSLSNMMTHLSHAKTLKFKDNSIEIFSANDVKKMLVNKFENLKTLKILKDYGSNVSCDNDFSVIATLLKNSPNLETISFNMNGTWVPWPKNYLGEDKYWEDQIPEMNHFLNHIRTVKFVGGFLEYYKDISLAKFLLKNGKVLEEMIFFIGPLETELELARRKFIKSALMKCSRASSKAKFLFQ